MAVGIVIQEKAAERICAYLRIEILMQQMFQPQVDQGQGMNDCDSKVAAQRSIVAVT